MDDGAVDFCRRLHPRLVGALTLQTGDARLAEELAQDALVRVVERWKAVSAMERPEAWTFRVAFNLTNSRFRRAAAERRALARTGVAPEAADIVEPDVAVAVRAAVADLPPKQRAAITCRYFADLSVAETAEALGCEPGTVTSLTSQAVASLRRTLAMEVLDA